MPGPASNVTDATMLYSPTPMKRRSSKFSRRRSMGEIQSGVVTPSQDFDDNCSKKSNQDSLSSKLGSTVGTVSTTGIDSDSDSDCDTRSFFSDAFSAISELHDPLEAGSPSRPGAEGSPKRKKKKKKEKSNKSPKSPKRRKKKVSTPKSEKSKKKKVKTPDKSKKKKTKSPRKRKSKREKIEDSIHHSDSEDDSFDGESFHGTHRVEPRIQQHEIHTEDIPGGPPLWGETDEEESRAETWEEDKSWLGWGEDDEKSEYIEDESRPDDFTYYTVHSNEDLDNTKNRGLGSLDEADIEDDAVTESTGISELTGISDFDKRSPSDNKRVFFNECQTIHETIHICDFTQKEIRQSWYQKKDYDETIQDVKEVVGNAETPRDTQTRFRKHRSLLSKNVETRGLELWTPSGVERFRYVKEAGFRAVWDVQQKQLDLQEPYEDDERNISTIIENQQKLREAYQRVSQRSLNEAQERAKKDEEIAAKLTPRQLKKRIGRRASWHKSTGSSSRSLLGSDLGLSDNPLLPPSCLLKREDSNDSASGLSTSGRRHSFGDIRRRLLRQDSNDSISNKNSVFKLKFEQSDRSLFRQVSDRSVFNKNPERGLFRQLSDRDVFQEKQGGLFRQSSDRSLLKKKGSLDLFLGNTSVANFHPISEEKQKPKKALTRRSSDIGMSLFKQNSKNRGLVRRSSLRF